MKINSYKADGPPFMGGSGVKPDPVQYCLFGLAACFAQTFASIIFLTKIYSIIRIY